MPGAALWRCLSAARTPAAMWQVMRESFESPDRLTTALGLQTEWSLLELEQLHVRLLGGAQEIPRTRRKRVEAIVAAFAAHLPTTPRRGLQMNDCTQLPVADSCCYCQQPSSHVCTNCGLGNAHPHCTQQFCPPLFRAPGGGRTAPEPLCTACAKEKLGSMPDDVLDDAHLIFSQAKRRPGWTRQDLTASLFKCLPLRGWKVCLCPSCALLQSPSPTHVPPTLPRADCRRNAH